MSRALPEIETALVVSATAGDSASVTAVVRALQGPVFAVAQRMLGDAGDAEDATQESLIRIVTRLGQFRGEARFTTWALRIAVRRILDFREHRAARASYSFDEFSADLADGADHEAPERIEDALLHRRIKIACTRAMLHCLDGDHRIAFVLGDVLELSSVDAAEVLEIEAATHRKRLSRARAAMQEFLGRNCGVYDAVAPCRCHARLGRALALGRVDPNALEAKHGDLVQLRRHISTFEQMRRVAAFFQADPELEHRRDFVVVVREMLTTLDTDHLEDPP